MVGEFKRLSTNQSWSYRWSFGDSPTVSFTNPKVKTIVNYTLNELQTVIAERDEDCGFIPVPCSVMKCALNAVDTNLNCAA